ncbi:MAG: hypothetical protein U0136_20920 [Bdellovibrionota bacterium]
MQLLFARTVGYREGYARRAFPLTDPVQPKTPFDLAIQVEDVLTFTPLRLPAESDVTSEDDTAVTEEALVFNFGVTAQDFEIPYGPCCGQRPSLRSGLVMTGRGINL